MMICSSGNRAATGSSSIGFDRPSSRPRPPGRPAPIPVWPVWKSATTPASCSVSYSAECAASEGSKPCTVGWNLKPRTPWSSMRRRASSTARRLQRVDRAERDEHVVVARGALGDVGARERRLAEVRLGVDREHDGGHAPLAVVRGDAVEIGVRSVGAEVLRRRVPEVVGQRRVTVMVDLDVHVHVDRRERVDVDRGFVAGHGVSCRSARSRPVGAGRWSSSGSGGNFSPTDCSSPAASANPVARSSYDQPPS